MRPIRILHLEDDPHDGEMVELALKSEGLQAELTRVEDGEAFERELRSDRFDLILSDFSLPSFDGSLALDLVQKIRPDLPFIFVSGMMGEELAVESLKQGAADYVLKRFISRLPTAVDRALRQAQARREKAQAEIDLRASEAKLAALIDNTKDSIWSVDSEFRFVSFNATAAFRFHLASGIEMRAGLRMMDLIPEALRPQWLEWFGRGMAGESFRVEQAFNVPDRFYEIAVNPIRTHDKVTGVAMFSRDVTERRTDEREILRQRDELEKANARLLENQAQLIQSEKLACLGQLSAGVAHEINNPMSFVTSNLRTLAKYLPAVESVLEGCMGLAEAAGEGREASEIAALKMKDLIEKNKLRRTLEDIGAIVSESLEGAQRVNEIVRSLKSVARADDGSPEPTDVHACLEDALKLAWNELKHKCSVSKDFGALPSIKGRPGQLKQVFLNLLVNAAQAIPDKGRITIHTSADRGKVVVEIEDDGMGIAEENLSRLFTPFFTTKPVGQGTGLGLSISYGIIQGHHGEMKVKSSPGHGTTFVVTLPVAEEGNHDGWRAVPGR